MNTSLVGPVAAKLEMPAQLLEQRAVLTLADRMPLSEVVQTYTASVLAFPPPK